MKMSTPSSIVSSWAPPAGMYVLLGPAAEGLGAAALVHQVYHDAEYDEEDQDTDVVAVGEHGDQAVFIADERLNRLPGGKLGVEQCADQAAEEQGGVNLLADERQHDGDRSAAGATRRWRRRASPR